MEPVRYGIISLLLTLVSGLPDGNLLYWSVVDGKQGQIRWLPADPQSYKDNATITATARYAGDYRWNAIAVDFHERNAIMSDSASNSIYNAREWFQAEGNAIQTVFGTSGYLVNAIAIDWFSRSFYWVDEGFNWIRLSTYDSVKTTLIIGTELEKPQGIAVYPMKGYLFWTDSARKHIERSSLTGKNRTILIENMRRPTDLTTDSTDEDGRIYWIDEASVYGQNHTIESSDCEGQGRRVEYNLLHQDGTLLDIAVDKDFIFVTIHSSSEGSVIRFLNKNSKATFFDLSLEEEVLDICLSGFDIQPYTPTGANVCIDGNPCNDFCVYDVEAGHECLCSDKLTLEADGANCTLDSVIQPPYLMFTRKNEISFIPVTLVHQGQAVSDGIDSINTLLRDSESPLALTIDFHDQLLFYSNQIDKSIKVVGIAVGELPEVVYRRIGQVEGMAVDWLANNIYWTDYEFNHVVVCSYDSRFTRELFKTDVIKPRSIVIDPFEKLLFWSELGPPGQIERSNLDGSNRRVLPNILSDGDQPSGLAIDLYKHRLYFANRLDGSISYMNYEGTDLNTLYIHPDGYLNFFDLTLYQDFIMWTESGGESNGIYVIYNENESGVDGSLLDSVSTIYSIETYDKSVQPAGSSLCDQENNGGCSRLCLTSLLNETSCACSDGFIVDANDYRQCVPASTILQDDFYLIADQEKHGIFQMNGNEPFEYIGLDLGEVGDPVSIAYDPIERRVYWVDAESNVIKRSSLDGSNVESVITRQDNIVSPKGVAVDYVTRLMFWSDSKLRKIEVSYLDGSVRYALIDTQGEEPRDIVVDPVGRRIFWSIQGNTGNPAIKSAYMDGGNERRLSISELISKPSGLVIHFGEGRLYWCDEDAGIIESINLDGTSPMLYVRPETPFQPSSLTVMLGDIVWSDNLQTSLRHLDSNTTTNVDGNHFGKMSSIHYHASISSLNESDAANGCLKENGGCSHICLPGRVAGQVTCKCNGDVYLLSDNKQCDTDILCPKTFLGGGVEDNCTRFINSTCHIYCIPQFNISNEVAYVTCNKFGNWDQDTDLLCTRTSDPVGIVTIAPQIITERPEASSEGISYITIIWIMFGVFMASVILIVSIVVVVRRRKTIKSTLPTDDKSAFDMAKRPLPDPEDDIYDDPDYNTIEELIKKNPAYYTHIKESGGKQKQKFLDGDDKGQVAGGYHTSTNDNSAFVNDYSTDMTNQSSRPKETPYYLTVVDGNDQKGTLDNEDGYLQPTIGNVENGQSTKKGVKETPYYLTIVDDKAEKHNSVANSTLVDGYTTRTSIATDENNSDKNSGFVDGYSTRASIATDENNSTKQSGLVDGYTTRTSTAVDADISAKKTATAGDEIRYVNSKRDQDLQRLKVANEKT